MMQIFVHGIATGAVEFDDDGWIWHGPDKDLVLTTVKMIRMPMLLRPPSSLRLNKVRAGVAGLKAHLT